MPYPDSEYPSILRGRDKRESQRLLAAAPELLAALKQCLPLVDAYRRASGGDGDASAAFARSVIAKAEGTDGQDRSMD